MPEELDFDFLKEKAFRLGISFRSDIKPETLKAKIDAKEAEAPQNEAPEPANSEAIKTTGPEQYINTTKQNIFTSAGRCKPKYRVILPAVEAEQIPGLDLCKV